jgi:hypothetical protein
MLPELPPREESRVRYEIVRCTAAVDWDALPPPTEEATAHARAWVAWYLWSLTLAGPKPPYPFAARRVNEAAPAEPGRGDGSG